ncbi:hypothetical protein NKH36_31740 [Mesorhizobium sp. M1312]|uniref:hypothetical protein n=1 Tax=unclassified Mesorhizobium TaxID=325217 RepID=UPI00333D87F4
MFDTKIVDHKRHFISKPRQSYFGAPIGILLLQTENLKFIPGSVGNAGTWSVPVRYKVVPGLATDLVLGPNGAHLSAAVAQAAVELVEEGAQLITSGCGFMIRFQEAVRSAVDVPVLLSPMLLAPMLEMMLPKDQSLGVITANASLLSPDVLAAAGISANNARLAVAGLEGAPAFRRAFLEDGQLDLSAMHAEVIDTAIALVKDRPDVGMLLLECSELPTYAAAIQEATGRPVFDFTSMVEFMVSGMVRRAY